MWVCERCGKRVEAELVYPIRCVCGYIDDGGPDATERPPLRVSWWESNSRMKVCRQCGYMVGNEEYCFHAGDSQRFLYRVRSAHATCPHKKWKPFESRWVSCAELASKAVALCSQLPEDASKIVGVPRSGMIAASVMATTLHLPLYTLREGDIEPIGRGMRMSRHKERDGLTVVVDDTCASGTSTLEIRKLLPDALTVAIYCSPDAHVKPDMVGEYLELPHMLEWNLFSCGYMAGAGLDLDGIICRNPPDQAVPRYLPRYIPPKAIITARPERERAETESWLTKWGVQYGELVMWPGEPLRRKGDTVADWKVEEMSRTGCEFYVESEVGLAHLMRERGARVLCPEEGVMK